MHALAVAVQEIVAIYPMLSPPTLTAQASNRVCNALALLQCVASHAETRALFLQGEAGSKGPPIDSRARPGAVAGCWERRVWPTVWSLIAADVCGAVVCVAVWQRTSPCTYTPSSTPSVSSSSPPARSHAVHAHQASEGQPILTVCRGVCAPLSEQEPAVRVPAFDEPGCDRSLGQGAER